MRKSTLMLLAASGALALSACAKKAPEALPTPPADTTPTPPPPPPAPTPTGPVPGSQEDFLASVAADRVFFDLDKIDIKDSEKATLDSQAAWLKRYPNVRVTLEGHADERGTREYNLALGERRANSAKNYLASIGIDAGRITVISYGKERPDALGSDEASWAKNRRAVTLTVQ